MAVDVIQCMLPVTSQWLEWSTKHPCWEELTMQTSHVTLISGKRNTLKTQLLFQAAVSYASDGCHVTFISRQPFSCLPRPVHGMPQPTPVVMKCLKMLYLTTYEDLIGYLTTIHQCSMIPNVLIVDDLHLFLNKESCQVGSSNNILIATLRENSFIHAGPLRQKWDSKQLQSVARLCALLVDTAHYLCSNSDTTSKVVVSVQDTATPRPVLAVVERFFRTKWHISNVANTAENTLQMVRSPYAQNDYRLLLTVGIDRAEIRLKQISVEEDEKS